LVVILEMTTLVLLSTLGMQTPETTVGPSAMERIMEMETLETTMEAMSTALASTLGMTTLVTLTTLGMQILESTMEQSTME